MKRLYADDGSTYTNAVLGTTFVGNQSQVSGAINTIQVNGTTYTGLKHFSGATNIYVSTNQTIKGNQHPCGALNVSVSPYVPFTNRITLSPN